MRNIKRIMWLIVVTAIVCALTLAVALPASANENANVAKIGDTEYATLDAAAKAAKTGDTITLLKDVDLGTSKVNFYNSTSTNLIFDLNGHKITSAHKDYGTVYASKDGLVIKNGTIENTYKDTKAKTSTSAVYVTGGGSTTLENVTLISNYSGLFVCQLKNSVNKVIEVTVNVEEGTIINGGEYGIYAADPAGTSSKIHKLTLNVNGGTITGITSYGILANGPDGGKYGTVNVKIAGGTISGVEVTTKNTIEDRAAKLEIIGGTLNGEVKGNGNNNIAVSGGTFNGNLTTAKSSTNKITITGGTFNGDLTTSVDSTNNVVITGGTFKGSITKNGNDNITVSGGTFSSEVKPEWCAKDFAVKANDDGTYSVKTIYVAKTGDNRYESLAAAISAASNGATVELLTETTEDVVIDKNITLDLGGFTLTGTGVTGKATLTIAESAIATVRNGSINGTDSYYTIENKGTATLEGLTATVGNNDSSRIENHGTLTINSGSYTGGLNTVKNEPSAMLTINGGTFTLTKGTSKGYTGVVFNYGTLEITGGEFIQSEKSSRYGYAQVIYTDKYGSVAPSTVIKGGTFKNLHTKSTAWTVRTANAAAGATKVSGGTFNKSVGCYYFADGSVLTKNADGTYGVREGQYVASIGITGYESLADAIAAAEDDDTVNLMKDIELDAQIAISKAITIDGQGKYTIKATQKLVSTTGKVGMFYRTQGAQGTLTFLDVTLDGNGVSKIFLNEGGAGETVFDGVTSINGGGMSYGSGIHISGGGSHATIRNSTLTGSTGTTELNADNYYAANDLWVGGNVYVTIENSTIGTVFVNSAPSATTENGVVHGQLTITGENTVINYLSGEEESADKLDKFGKNGSLVKIKAGTVKTVFDKGSYAISGGVFNIEVKKEWCVEGFAPKALADGTYGVEQLVKLEATEGVLGESVKFYILTNRYVGLKFRVRITLNGEEVIYNGVDYEKNGTEYYAYILDLPPQYLDADLKIELINNSDEAIQTVNYSFLKYCEAVLNKDTNAKQLVADLLWYSVAAKNKCKLESTTLTAKLGELGLVQSTGEIKATVTKSHTKTGEESYISGATLYHDSMNRIIILVDSGLYENTKGNHTYTYKKGNGAAQELVKIGELVTDGPTYVMLATEGIYANEFDTAYTIEVTFNGEVVETLVYSVNNYCETKAPENELAKALYYYGVSAAAYKHS